LTKDGHEILFDIVINTDQGRLYGMCLKQTLEVANVFTMVSAIPTQTIHGRLGHINVDACRIIATKIGWPI
jgi:hypothetical protein